MSLTGVCVCVCVCVCVFVQLEVHLTDKEAQFLEMELVYEQVTRLSQRIQIKAENGKEDTLHLAKKVSLQTDLL